MRFLILLLLPFSVFAAEVDYQNPWCAANNGVTEVVLSDRTRIDCLTETHAIEVDFGRKWAESVGQSLHYAMHTGKRAGIVLIVDKDRYLKRLKAVISHYNLPIDVFEVRKTPPSDG